MGHALRRHAKIGGAQEQDCQTTRTSFSHEEEFALLLQHQKNATASGGGKGACGLGWTFGQNPTLPIFHRSIVPLYP